MPPLSLSQRLSNSLREHGVGSTAGRILLFPFRRLHTLPQRYRYWRLANSSDPKVIFEQVHKLNFWGSTESVSGPGSTLEYTASLRHHLGIIVGQFGIGSVFDAPCGDFNWMRTFLATHPLKYIGGDIVPALVHSNQSRHGNSRTRFVTFDLMRDSFPSTDLWFCRDCLFHLSFRQIYAVLENFSRSEIRYALLTNHRCAPDFVNTDIRTGGFRKLNLLAPPFNLPADFKYRFQEGPTGESDHEMCLWDRTQIAAALPAFNAALAKLPPTPER